MAESVADLPLRYGVPIGQNIDFQDCRATIVGAYPGQVRIKWTELDQRTREPTGRTRVKTHPRSEYDGWVAKAQPGAMPRAPEPATAPAGDGVGPGRHVKIMRASQSSGRPDGCLDEGPAVAWEDSEFERLAAGDVFMVVESDGTEVPGGPWLARGPAYRDGRNGVWTVDCDPLKIDEPAVDPSPSGDPDLVLG